MTMRSTTSKKTLQSFHARDSLWLAFNKHAEQMECSVDYLVNEAMRLYASTHGFLVDTGVGENPVESAAAPMPPQRSELSQGTAAPPMPPKTMAPTLRERPNPMTIPLPRPGSTRPGAGPVGPTPVGGLPRPGSLTGSGAGLPPPPRRPSVNPPPPPPSTRPGGEELVSGTVPTSGLPIKLTVIFQGRKTLVDKEQFIIGRGSKTSDLPIKDANVSRKHAAVIFHNGAFYMKDLGSTNGVEYNGSPVDSKRIDEGDVFTICGYDIHFTYQV